MAKSKMKKNSSVHKVSERALQERREKEELEAEEARKKAFLKARRRYFTDAALNSLGGILTLFSLLFGFYGIFSAAALVLLVPALKKNWSYGWRGILIPAVCIAINAVWLPAQIGLIVSPEFRVWFYQLFSGIFG